MYDPYDDHELIEFVENCGRDRLEMEYMNLVRKYRNLSREHKQFISNVGWERTMRQQERSGGTM
jgi:hypothetical protein